MYRTQNCLMSDPAGSLVFGFWEDVMTLIVDLFGFLLMAGSIHLTLAFFLAVPMDLLRNKILHVLQTSQGNILEDSAGAV